MQRWGEEGTIVKLSNSGGVKIFQLLPCVQTRDLETS